MQDSFEDPEVPRTKAKISPLTVVIGAVAIIVVAVSFWFLFEPVGRHSQAIVQVQMSPAEQQYAKNIEIGNLAMSRAENFLHQEVTTLTGQVHNAGTEPVLALALTAEFYDDMHQIVLRETRSVLSAPAAKLAPGERRTFEISLEHIPVSWNMQPPAMSVARLQLPNQ